MSPRWGFGLALRPFQAATKAAQQHRPTTNSCLGSFRRAARTCTGKPFGVLIALMPDKDAMPCTVSWPALAGTMQLD